VDLFSGVISNFLIYVDDSIGVVKVPSNVDYFCIKRLGVVKVAKF